MDYIRYVIEPHADDAFLSLGGHIARWIKKDIPVKIITVFATEKRAAEAKAYADSVGADHEWLGYEEAGDMDDCKYGDIELPEFRNSLVYVPLGLRHREHYKVAAAAFSQLQYGENGVGLYSYLDQPYAMQLKNQEEMQIKMYGKQIVSIYKPKATKYAKKTIDIFKTQSRFFYFNKDILPFITELVVK